MSERALGTLNLSYHVGDDPRRVSRNRALVGCRTGIGVDSWVLGHQVHGASVAVVTEQHRGRGAVEARTALEATDALVTADRGVALVVLVADCVPVMLVDPQTPAIGLAHAGWRGTAAHVTAETVRTMQREYDCDPTSLCAYLGPSIGPDDYAVAAETAGAIRRSYPDHWSELLRERLDGSLSLDLWRANAVDLETVGVPPDRITVEAISTAAHTDRFFSHRAEGPTGRFAALLLLP